MAKQVIWSLRAQNDKKEILDYWRQRNKSNTYSKKLNELFKESIKIILDFPQIGKVTDDTKARIKIVRDYLIIYEETETQIFILTIWDSRQDPEKLEKILR
jgi:addiction module RelE/StbE family toxin